MMRNPKDVVIILQAAETSKDRKLSGERRGSYAVAGFFGTSSRGCLDRREARVSVSGSGSISGSGSVSYRAREGLPKRWRREAAWCFEERGRGSTGNGGHARRVREQGTTCRYGPDRDPSVIYIPAKNSRSKHRRVKLDNILKTVLKFSLLTSKNISNPTKERAYRVRLKPSKRNFSISP